MRANMLSLNIDKTSAMVFSNRRYCQEVGTPLQCDGKDVEAFAEGTFLGLYSDSKLYFGGHISNLYGKVSKSVGIF